MLQAIIFDFDGVIVDSEPLHFQATQSVFAPLGGQIDFPMYLQECIGQPDLENFRRLCNKFQLKTDEDYIQNLVRSKIEHYRQLLPTQARPCEGAISLIKQAAQHYPLAICSGSFKNEINQLLSLLDSDNLSDYFKKLITIEDVSAGKPDPTGYRLAATSLNVLPQFCLAIEDSPSGIIAAKAAGMTVLAVTTSYSQEKLSLADHCVDSLSGITLADLNRITASSTV
jgi:beta-phosphoglucomutase